MLSAVSNLAVISFFIFTLTGLFFGIKGDLNFHSDLFMKEKISSSMDSSLRDVASKDGEKVTLLYFPLSNENYSRISGKWLIYNFIDANDKDEKVNTTVNLELVGNSRIIIDGDSQLEFRISYLSSLDRIAMVRKVDGGYEILEAEKIKEEAEVKKETIAKESNSSSSPKGVKMIEGELILERATNPAKSQKIYAGELVRGSMNVSDNSINNFEAVIYEENGSFQTIEFPFAQINDGGQFEIDVAGFQSQAIFTNNGKDAFRVRFATGPQAGLLLNFITEDKWYENREAEYSNEGEERSREENRLVVTKLNVEQANIVNERSDRAFMESQDISEATQEDISPEEMAERLKASSFNFSDSSAQENEG